MLKWFLGLMLLATPVVAQTVGYPLGAVPFVVSSPNLANTPMALVVPGEQNKRTYITSFTCSADNGSSATPLVGNIDGLIGGQIFFVVKPGATGDLVSGTIELMSDSYPIPAAGVGTNVLLALPALGPENTLTFCTIFGFRALETQ